MFFAIPLFHAVCYLADMILALYHFWCYGLLNAHPLFEPFGGYCLRCR